MFDFNFGGIAPPDNNGFSYETEQARIKRLLAQAAMFTKAGQTAPQGQMVGNQFVAPSWSQQLAPVLNSILGGLTNRQADEASAQLEKASQEQAMRWMANKPTTGPAQVFGSVEEPLDSGINIPGSVPSRDDMLKWAMTGATNPLTKTLAAEYLKDQLITEPDRIAKREDAATLAREKMLQDAQLKREGLAVQLRQIEGLLSEKGQTREMMERLAKMADETKRQIAASNDALKGTLIEARTAAAANRTVPQKTIDTLTGFERAVEAAHSSAQGFKPEYVGSLGVGTVNRALGDYSPVATDTQREGAKWWKAYDFSQLEEMHKLFGSALTAPEQERWKKATIDENMNADQVRANLQTRAELSAKMYNAARERYSTLIGPKVGEVFLPYTSPFQTKEAPAPSPNAAPLPVTPTPSTGAGASGTTGTKMPTESEAIRRLMGTLPDTRSPQALKAWADSVKREMPTLNAEDRAYAEGLLRQLEREIATTPSVLPRAAGSGASAPQSSRLVYNPKTGRLE